MAWLYGQRVLIHAGSGGVGTLAIQIAKHAGAWVATTASAKNKELVMVSAPTSSSTTRASGSRTSREVDLVFDMLGDETLARSFDAVKPGGTIVSIKGDAPDGLAADRDVTFHSFFMQPNGAQLAEMAALITDGTIRPVLDRSFPLDEVAAAYDYARTGGPNGKVAVAVR